ncbi:ABC transporter substrate-binding protein [Streptomyces sp. NPDC090088]|uniref:ABC transporter substrate-binding protein n=1 Tax=Streptomyces sp. NPDC090088 TaxID=3365944 RepID=UPI00380DC3D7
MTSRRLRLRVWSLLTAATMLSAGACTAEKKADAAGAASPGGVSAPSVGRAAPGVTDDSIKIGVVYPDFSSVKQYLHIDHGDYRATYGALIKKLNDSGGINGRKIIPVYGAINVTSPSAAQETCVKLTQDEKVFAVIGTLSTNEPLCYVQNNRTAVVGGPLTTKNYALAKAPWFSTDRGGDELYDALGLFAAALKGRKVAVAGVANEQSLVQDTVVPTLKKLGVTPVQVAISDANPQDAVATAQQANVFLTKFQASGADTLVLAGGAAVTFPAALEKTKYRPRLLFTSRDEANIYAEDNKSKHDYSTLSDALTLGTVDQWSESTVQKCVGTVENAVPKLKGKLGVDPATLPPGAFAPQIALTDACTSLNLFGAIAGKAGRKLDYETFQSAGFSLGTFPLPGKADKADYTEKTPHGAVPFRLFTYDSVTSKFVPSAS